MEKRENSNSYSQILKYTSLFGGVQGLNILIGLVRNKLVSVILGPNGMGLVSLFNSTIRIVSDSTNFGISMSAVKNISQIMESGDREQVMNVVQTVRMWSFITALLGMLVCVVLSPWLNRWTFDWGDHTLHFIMLAPVVALIAITGGETAILKGGRHLKSLAVVSVYNMLFALVCSVPLFYFFGQTGIVPSLILMALAQCILTIAYSYKFYRPKFLFSKRHFNEGKGMIKLGLAFVVAGIFGSGAEFLIRSFLNNISGLDSVGLYNAGFVMTMTYTSMVFSSLEADYFPRLSSIKFLGDKLNETVNHQMEVTLLLISPMLVFFMVLLPILLPLLFSNEFLPIVNMMRFSLLAMYFRAINLPMEYISLSRGDSHSYLLLEAAYYIIFVLMIVIGFQWRGLTGTGVAIMTCTVVNTVMVLIYVHWKYGYWPSGQVVVYALIQIFLGMVTCVSTFAFTGVAYWLIGMLLTVLSLGISIQILRSKTHLWSSLMGKLSSRFHCKK
ncbi:MAG: oligosaccharide flippase family protein [Prevotella sp.]|jgi:O-antigen/teichoic acid export membrane protein